MAFFKKRKVIIGIHGLNNKPPQDLLEKWWRQSINEGLERIGRPVSGFDFELVYWAKYFYDQPLDPSIGDPKHPLFLKTPYVRGAEVRKKPKLASIKKKMLDGLEKRLDAAFFKEESFIKWDKISDFLIRNLFRDLDVYYHRHCAAKKYSALPAMAALREELARALKKHRGKEILLISHSMGTIISYDVLTQTVPDIPVRVFITIGSPLGLPVIKKKIFAERNMGHDAARKAPAPENITEKWCNFSDLDDPIATNYSLADDYFPSVRGVAPIDYVVYNDYEYRGDKDHHSAFGYLRTPEASAVIADFLKEEKISMSEAFRGLISRVFAKRR